MGTADIAFAAVDYHTVFDLHPQLRSHKRSTLLDKISTMLYNVGRFHSGTQAIAPVITAAVSANAFAAALKEYEGILGTETGGWRVNFYERDCYPRQSGNMISCIILFIYVTACDGEFPLLLSNA